METIIGEVGCHSGVGAVHASARGVEGTDQERRVAESRRGYDRWAQVGAVSAVGPQFLAASCTRFATAWCIRVASNMAQQEACEAPLSSIPE